MLVSQADAVIVRYATRVNGITGYFLTKLDMLSAWLHVTNGCNLCCPYCYLENPCSPRGEQDQVREPIHDVDRVPPRGAGL